MVAGLGLGALPPDGNVSSYAGLLFGGALLWTLAVAAYARIVEYPGATDGAVDGVAEALGKLALLRDDVPFRRFVVARALLSIAVALAAWLGGPGWLYLAAFLGLGVAHAGVRLGRKTYLVDLAEGNRRTDYVAVSNSVIGALLLVWGALGALTATWSVPSAVLALGLAGLAGAALSQRWKAVV